MDLLIDSDVDQLKSMIDPNATALTRLTAAVVAGFMDAGRALYTRISRGLVSACGRLVRV
ncbi:hypothetical protein [Paraburkholderia sp. GAS348]|uniref:hypothetical protein n=1 Tax=Paraburkholderia sp. GAS348 TaxID=3035132 RepID=UPI003D1FE30B